MMQPTTKVVENSVKALEVVQELNKFGYMMDDIYVLAHDADITHRIAALGNTKEIGVEEEGFLQSMANLVRSRGDELRSKMESLGIPESEAKILEKEMDQGHVLVITIK